MRYAKEKYGLTETASVDREYIEQIKCLKESLILQYEPELLGEMQDIPCLLYTSPFSLSLIN